MLLDAFSPGQRANVVRAERGYAAYIPPPLPPDVPIDRRLLSVLSSADRAIGELAGVGSSLISPHLLARTLVRREAVLSSRIEGTMASLSDLALFEAERPANPQVEDVQEVFNYVTALEHVLDPQRRLPLSVSLLREAHRILLTDVRGGYATPGALRHSQNWIGAPGCTLNSAAHVPPPPERLWECLDPFEKWLHVEDDLPPLLRIAALHYQFEAIHPFVDGNGRVGRLMIVLLLVEWGILPEPMLDLSAYFERVQDEYYRRLLAVSTTGDWSGWYEFFLSGVAEQAADAVRRGRRLQRLRDDYRQMFTGQRASTLPLRLIDALFEVPALSMRRAEELLGISRRSSYDNVTKLLKAGVLQEVETSGYRRLFLAPEIIAIVDDAE